MATSPLFGWEEPDDVDLVKDGAAAIRTLGNAIDTSMGDLLGGTTGQVLSKNSNTNMDFTWVTSDDANAIQNTIVDAKGDLIAASASDVPARLAVGTDGQALVADSTASTGLKWATPSQVLLNTTTFSAVSSQSVNDVFSSTYAYYKLYFSLTANSGTNAAIKLAMRVSSTDTQMTSEYIEQYAGTVTGVESTAPGTGGIFVKTHSTYGSYCRGVMDIIDPNTASVQTNASGRFLGVTSAGQPFQYISNLFTDATTQFTGFTITPSTGTISGTLRVYGVTI